MHLIKSFVLFIVAPDEKIFHENPEEYIRRNNNSDGNIRRQAAGILVKILWKNFADPAHEMCQNYLQNLLHSYSGDLARYWRAKSTAILLVSSLKTYASQIVSLQVFCTEHIIPELMRPSINEFPVLKADALKFMKNFSKPLVQQLLMTHLTRIEEHSKSQSHVVSICASNLYDEIRQINEAKKKEKRVKKVNILECFNSRQNTANIPECTSSDQNTANIPERSNLTQKKVSFAECSNRRSCSLLIPIVKVFLKKPKRAMPPYLSTYEFRSSNM